MNIRSGFDADLNVLKQSIVQLGEEAVHALDHALDAFKNQDQTLMEKVIKNDDFINKLELEINEKATRLIAMQQPVASDLRKIIVALKVSSDLERVGDLAVDIAKGAKRLNDQAVIDFGAQVIELAEMAKGMLTTSLQAYEAGDVLQAQKISHFDDNVDAQYKLFIKHLFTSLHEQGNAEYITQLAFLGRYLERIGDYSTNIAEWTIYEVNGQRFVLN